MSATVMNIKEDSSSGSNFYQEIMDLTDSSTSIIEILNESAIDNGTFSIVADIEFDWDTTSSVLDAFFSTPSYSSDGMRAYYYQNAHAPNDGKFTFISGNEGSSTSINLLTSYPNNLNFILNFSLDGSTKYLEIYFNGVRQEFLNTPSGSNVYKIPYTMQSGESITLGDISTSSTSHRFENSIFRNIKYFNRTLTSSEISSLQTPTISRNIEILNAPADTNSISLSGPSGFTTETMTESSGVYSSSQFTNSTPSGIYTAIFNNSTPVEIFRIIKYIEASNLLTLTDGTITTSTSLTNVKLYKNDVFVSDLPDTSSHVVEVSEPGVYYITSGVSNIQSNKVTQVESSKFLVNNFGVNSFYSKKYPSLNIYKAIILTYSQPTIVPNIYFDSGSWKVLGWAEPYSYSITIGNIFYYDLPGSYTAGDPYITSNETIGYDFSTGTWIDIGATNPHHITTNGNIVTGNNTLGEATPSFTFTDPYASFTPTSTIYTNTTSFTITQEITITSGAASATYFYKYDPTFSDSNYSSTSTYLVYALYTKSTPAPVGSSHNIAYNVSTGQWEDPNGGNHPSGISGSASGETITWVYSAGTYAVFTNPYYATSSPNIGTAGDLSQFRTFLNSDGWLNTSNITSFNHASGTLSWSVNNIYGVNFVLSSGNSITKTLPSLTSKVIIKCAEVTSGGNNTIYIKDSDSDQIVASKELVYTSVSYRDELPEIILEFTPGYYYIEFKRVSSGTLYIEYIITESNKSTTYLTNRYNNIFVNGLPNQTTKVKLFKNDVEYSTQTNFNTSFDIYTKYDTQVGSSTGTTDNFGETIASYDDTLVVGAYTADSNKGLAYIYVYQNNTWTLKQTLNPASRSSAHNFGRGVSIYKDTIAICGTPNSTGENAYIYTRDTPGDLNSSWTLRQTITEYLGYQIKIYEDTLVSGNYPNGKVFVYSRDTPGDLTSSWSLLQEITKGSSNKLGYSVDLHKDIIVAGARDDSSNKGAAYVYVRKMNKYFYEEATLVGSTSTTSDLVGVSVSVYNDTILVGGNLTGKSYVFEKNYYTNTWDEIKILSVGPQDRTSMIVTENNLLIGDFSNNKAFLYKKLYNHNSTSSDWLLVKEYTSTGQYGQSVSLHKHMFVGQPQTNYVSIYYGNFNTSFEIGEFGNYHAYVYDSSDKILAITSKYNHQRYNYDDNYEIKLVPSTVDSTDYFGKTLSMYENTFCVSAHGATSIKVYIYVYEDEMWKLQDSISSSVSNLSLDALSINKDTLVIGSHGDLVQVYVRNNKKWVLQQEILGSDYGASSTNFGEAVRVYEDTLVIGDYGMNSTKGKIWIFERNNYIWSLKQTFEPDDGGSYFGFSKSFDINNDIFVAGAYAVNKLYVYVKYGFVYKHLITLSGPSGTEYAENVTIYNDLIVVGLKEGRSTKGSVYIYKFESNDVRFLQELVASDSTSSSEFANSNISIKDDIIVVGAYNMDSAKGCAYIFERSGDYFYEKSILKPSVLENNDRFGIDVATNGKFVVVSADYDDDNGTNSGSVYVYRLQDKPVIEFDNINTITTKYIPFNTSQITLQLNGTNHETKSVSHGIENIDFNIFVSGNYKFLYYDSSNNLLSQSQKLFANVESIHFIKPSFSQSTISSDYTLNIDLSNTNITGIDLLTNDTSTVLTTGVKTLTYDFSKSVLNFDILLKSQYLNIKYDLDLINDHTSIISYFNENQSGTLPDVAITISSPSSDTSDPLYEMVAYELIKLQNPGIHSNHKIYSNKSIVSGHSMHKLFATGSSYYHNSTQNTTLTSITVGNLSVSVKHRNSYVYEFDSKYFITKIIYAIPFIGNTSDRKIRYIEVLCYNHYTSTYDSIDIVPINSYGDIIEVKTLFNTKYVKFNLYGDGSTDPAVAETISDYLKIFGTSSSTKQNIYTYSYRVCKGTEVEMTGYDGTNHKISLIKNIIDENNKIRYINNSNIKQIITPSSGSINNMLDDSHSSGSINTSTTWTTTNIEGKVIFNIEVPFKIKEITFVYDRKTYYQEFSLELDNQTVYTSTKTNIKENNIYFHDEVCTIIKDISPILSLDKNILSLDILGIDIGNILKIELHKDNAYYDDMKISYNHSANYILHPNTSGNFFAKIITRDSTTSSNELTNINYINYDLYHYDLKIQEDTGKTLNIYCIKAYNGSYLVPISYENVLSSTNSVQNLLSDDSNNVSWASSVLYTGACILRLVTPQEITKLHIVQDITNYYPLKVEHKSILLGVTSSIVNRQGSSTYTDNIIHLNLFNNPPVLDVNYDGYDTISFRPISSLINHKELTYNLDLYVTDSWTTLFSGSIYNGCKKEINISQSGIYRVKIITHRNIEFTHTLDEITFTPTSKSSYYLNPNDFSFYNKSYTQSDGSIYISAENSGDNNGNYISFDAASILTNSNFTLQFDIKPISMYNSAMNYLVQIAQPSSGYYANALYFAYNSSSNQFYFSENSDNIHDYILPLNKYTTITLVSSTSSPFQKLYINGIQVSFSSTIDSAISLDTSSSKLIYIGNIPTFVPSLSNMNNHQMEACYKNIKLFNYVLTDQEILNQIASCNTSPLNNVLLNFNGYDRITIVPDNGNSTFGYGHYGYTLQNSSSLSGPWTTVDSGVAISDKIVTISNTGYYRVTAQGSDLKNTVTHTLSNQITSVNSSYPQSLTDYVVRFTYENAALGSAAGEYIKTGTTVTSRGHVNSTTQYKEGSYSGYYENNTKRTSIQTLSFPLTFCSWIYLNDAPSTYPPIITNLGYRDVGGGRQMFIGFKQTSTGVNGFHIAFQQTSGWASADISATVLGSSVGWIHVCAVIQNTSTNLYLNGQLLHTLSYTMNDLNGGVDIGGAKDYSSLLDGYLDDVRIYDRVLSATDISDIYNNTTINYTSIPTLSLSSNTLTLTNPPSTGTTLLYGPGISGVSMNSGTALLDMSDIDNTWVDQPRTGESDTASTSDAIVSIPSDINGDSSYGIRPSQATISNSLVTWSLPNSTNLTIKFDIYIPNTNTFTLFQTENFRSTYSNDSNHSGLDLQWDSSEGLEVRYNASGVKRFLNTVIGTDYTINTWISVELIMENGSEFQLKINGNTMTNGTGMPTYSYFTDDDLILANGNAGGPAGGGGKFDGYIDNLMIIDASGTDLNYTVSDSGNYYVENSTNSLMTNLFVYNNDLILSKNILTVNTKSTDTKIELYKNNVKLSDLPIVGNTTSVVIGDLGSYYVVRTLADSSTFKTNTVIVESLIQNYDSSDLTILNKMVSVGGATGTSTGDMSYFGISQAINFDADVVVVGDPFNDTTSDASNTYIFEKRPFGWVQTAVFYAPQNHMGRHVSIYDTTAVSSDNTNGKTYIFNKSVNGTWCNSQLITGSNLGVSNAIYDNTLVISNNLSSGSVFVYKRYDKYSDFTLYQTITKSGSSYFGQNVKIFKNILLVVEAVGTNKVNVYIRPHENSDFAYVDVIQGSGSGVSSFGNYNTALFENTIVIGSSNEDTQTGHIYVYTIDDNGTIINLQQKISASDTATNKYFGKHVSIYDNIIVSQSIDNIYVFEYNSGIWSETSKINESNIPNGGISFNSDNSFSSIHKDTIIFSGNYNESYDSLYVYKIKNLSINVEFDYFNILNISNISPSASSINLYLNGTLLANPSISSNSSSYTISSPGNYMVRSFDANNFLLEESQTITVDEIYNYSYEFKYTNHSSDTQVIMLEMVCYDDDDNIVPWDSYNVVEQLVSYDRNIDVLHDKHYRYPGQYRNDFSDLQKQYFQFTTSSSLDTIFKFRFKTSISRFDIFYWSDDSSENLSTTYDLENIYINIYRNSQIVNFSSSDVWYDDYASKKHLKRSYSIILGNVSSLSLSFDGLNKIILTPSGLNLSDGFDYILQHSSSSFDGPWTTVDSGVSSSSTQEVSITQSGFYRGQAKAFLNSSYVISNLSNEIIFTPSTGSTSSSPPFIVNIIAFTGAWSSSVASSTRSPLTYRQTIDNNYMYQFQNDYSANTFDIAYNFVNQIWTINPYDTQQPRFIREYDGYVYAGGSENESYDTHYFTFKNPYETNLAQNPRFTSANTIDLDSNWTIGSGWQVSASTSIGDAFNGFSHNNTSVYEYKKAWLSNSNPATDEWLQIQYPSAYVLKRYSILNRTTAFINGWKIQGSNNGTDWTTLDTQTGITTSTWPTTGTWTNGSGYSNESWFIQNITNNDAYSFYRIFVPVANQIVNANSSGMTYATFAELRLYTETSSSTDITMLCYSTTVANNPHIYRVVAKDLDGANVILDASNFTAPPIPVYYRPNDSASRLYTNNYTMWPNGHDYGNVWNNYSVNTGNLPEDTVLFQISGVKLSSISIHQTFHSGQSGQSTWDFENAKIRYNNKIVNDGVFTRVSPDPDANNTSSLQIYGVVDTYTFTSSSPSPPLSTVSQSSLTFDGLNKLTLAVSGTNLSSGFGYVLEHSTTSFSGPWTSLQNQFYSSSLSAPDLIYNFEQTVSGITDNSTNETSIVYTGSNSGKFDGTEAKKLMFDDFVFTKELTVALWVYYTTDSKVMILFQNFLHTTTTNGSFTVRIDNGTGSNSISMYRWTSSSSYAGNTYNSNNLTPNTWYHITVDISNFDLYINGINIPDSSPVDFSSGTVNSSSRLQFGYGFNGTTPSNFYIDDIKLFNSTLTSTEISDLYNSYISPPSIEYTITQTGFYRARVQGTDIGTPIISPLASEIFYTPYTETSSSATYVYEFSVKAAPSSSNDIDITEITSVIDSNDVSRTISFVDDIEIVKTQDYIGGSGSSTSLITDGILNSPYVRWSTYSTNDILFKITVDYKIKSLVIFYNGTYGVPTFGIKENSTDISFITTDITGPGSLNGVAYTHGVNYLINNYQATLSFDNVNTLTLSDFDTSNTSLVAYYNNDVRVYTLSPASNSINSTIYSSGNYFAQLVNSSNQIIGISNTITSTIDTLSFDGYYTLSFPTVDASSSIELYKDSVKLSDISTSTTSIQIANTGVYYASITSNGITSNTNTVTVSSINTSMPITYKISHKAASTVINSYMYDLEIIDINDNEITYNYNNFTILGNDKVIIYANPSTNNPTGTKLNASIGDPIVGIWSFESITTYSNPGDSNPNKINWNNTGLASNDTVDLFSYISDVRIKTIKFTANSDSASQFTSHVSNIIIEENGTEVYNNPPSLIDYGLVHDITYSSPLSTLPTSISNSSNTLSIVNIPANASTVDLYKDSVLLTQLSSPFTYTASSSGNYSAIIKDSNGNLLAETQSLSVTV